MIPFIFRSLKKKESQQTSFFNAYDAHDTIFLRFDLRENRILGFNKNDFVIPEYLSITCASFDSYSTRETRSHTAMRIPRLLLDSSREKSYG